MSPAQSQTPKRTRFHPALALLVLASAIGLCASLPLLAQEGVALRGSLLEQDSVETSAIRPTTTDPGSRGLAVTEADQSTAPLQLSDDFGDSAATANVSTTVARSNLATAEAEPDITGTIRTKTIDSDLDLALDKGAEREKPIEGLERTQEDKPFDAPGIRFGSFIVRPTLEQGITATDNADSTANGSDAVLSETTLRLNAVADWKGDSAELNAYGNFRRTLSGDEIEDVSGGIDAALTKAIGRDYVARGTLAYAIVPESASSPVAIVGAEDQPYHETFTGTLGLDKAIGKARLGATGRIEHDRYGDAEFADGTTLSQADRDATLYALTLRAGYEISPALTPFIEAEVGRRIYDLRPDFSGYERSSDRLAFRGGLAVDLGEKLKGEASGGWIRETFDDDRLNPIEGPSINGTIAWSPQRGTIVDLTGSTVVEGTSSVGDSGSLLYLSRLTVERDLRSNLTGNASVGFAYRDYIGFEDNDKIFSADASMTYWLSRYLGLTGRVRHETVASTIEGRDSQTNSVYLGLKLQR